MAIEYKNVKKLNLEETVQQLVNDVAEHRQITAVLADLGINVLGIVESETVLDTVPTENLIYGDAYLVGASEPYNLHVWTRANPALGHDTAYWLGVGPISVAGPEGPAGPSVSSAEITSDFRIALTLNNGTTILTTGESLRGAKGDKGDKGAKGDKGDKGDPGTKGDPGPAGPAGSFNLLGRYSDQSLIPPISTVVNGDAALVYNSNRDGYDIWVVADGEWVNMGAPGAGTTIYVNGQIQTDWNADTKLDKVSTTATRDRVYAVTADGTQTLLQVSPVYTTSNAIVQRSGGHIQVPETPIANTQAASKKYVDDSIANINIPTGGGVNFDVYFSNSTYVDLPIDGSWKSSKFIIVDLIGYDYDMYANHFTACFCPDNSSYQYIDSNRDRIQFYVESGYNEQISALFNDEDTRTSYMEWAMKVVCVK